MLTRWFLGHCLTEGGKKRVFTGLPLGWVEWDQCAQPEVALMLHMCNTAEAPQEKVMVCVVPGVPDGHILGHTAVHTNDVVHPGPHFLDMTEHAPRSTDPITR